MACREFHGWGAGASRERDDAFRGLTGGTQLARGRMLTPPEALHVRTDRAVVRRRPVSLPLSLPTSQRRPHRDGQAIKTLKPDELQKMNAYWRAANYLSVGQIYLYDNPLLKRAAEARRT